MRLQAFAGRWTVERDIEDVRSGRAGRFAGRARFRPVDGALAYREDGELTLAGAAPLAATRSYLWRDGGAGTIEVLFEDGRLFHRFCADEPAPSAEHSCPPDRYRVHYDFRAWPRWRAEWQVRGPRKHHGIVSRFAPDAS